MKKKFLTKLKKGENNMKTKLWKCGTCFVDNIGEICTNCESNKPDDKVQIITTEVFAEIISAIVKNAERDLRQARALVSEQTKQTKKGRK